MAKRRYRDSSVDCEYEEITYPIGDCAQRGGANNCWYVAMEAIQRSRAARLGTLRLEPGEATVTVATRDDALRVRAGPGTNYEIVTHLERGQRISITGKTQSNFIEVWLGSPHRNLWVSAEFIQGADRGLGLLRDKKNIRAFARANGFGGVAHAARVTRDSLKQWLKSSAALFFDELPVGDDGALVRHAAILAGVRYPLDRYWAQQDGVWQVQYANPTAGECNRGWDSLPGFRRFIQDGRLEHVIFK